MRSRLVLLARGAARFDRAAYTAQRKTGSCRAAALLILSLAPLSGCEATDVVARLERACPGGDAACADASMGEDASAPETGPVTEAGPPEAGPIDAGGAGEAGDADAAPEASTPPCGAHTCAALGSHDALCAGSGTVVLAGDSCASETTPSSARHALCTCDDLVSSSSFVIDAFMGTLQQPVANAAHIGVNTNLALGGSGSVDGELRVVGRHDLAPSMQVDSLVQVQSPPCRCELGLLLDIEALVRAHRSDHDNARAGVSEAELDGFTAAKELALPCGRYYFTRIKSEAPLTIRARGNVAIFIGDSIALGDALRIQTEDDAGQVNVFVGGEGRVSGSLWMGGNPNGRARVSWYHNGTGTLELGASAEITGQLYAPHAELVNRGTLKVYGSMFVERAAHAAALELHYDTAAATPAQCDP